MSFQQLGQADGIMKQSDGLLGPCCEANSGEHVACLFENWKSDLG